jgi:prolyl-tRNA synthetase
MAEAKVPVFAAFKELGIDVTTVDHPEVHTVEEQEKHIGSLSGIHTKNLFLKDKKHGFFLVTAETTSDTNSKAVAKLCGLTGKVNLRFASPEALLELCGVKQGSVSPLCVMNDKENKVTLVLDAKIANAEHVVVHPCFCDASTQMKVSDLMKFSEHFGHTPKVVDFGGGNGPAAPPSAPAARKDSKPKEKKPKAPKKKAEKPKPEGAGGKKATKLGVTHDKYDDFPEWYSEVIREAEMIEYYDISGCYILRPWSYRMWEFIQEFLDAKIKSIGVSNSYFPMFVSKAALQAEEDHVEGFAPEVAWVTKSGESDMAEHIAVRPTSETIMYPAYAKWIRSHRDLPLKLNQWNNVVRWEFKYPTPFLRTREFLWQEGHTAFAKREDANAEVLEVLEFYRQVYEELMAVPVIKGVKTEKEKFAGGDFTTTVEGFIPVTGRAIQGATSHQLGQNFGKIFGISFEDEEGKTAIPWQNSWGLTTRTIGVMVMVHGDNQGLVLPPRMAPLQVVIVPILMKTGREELIEKCKEIESSLAAAGIRVQLDDRENYNPGWKYNYWEMKGVCLRLEVGPRDLAKSQVCMVRRDNQAKEDVPLRVLAAKVEYTLACMQHDLLAKATAERDSRLTTVMEWKDFVPALLKGNMCLTPWCNDETEEDNVKDKSKEEALAGEEEDDRTATSAAAKTLCIPYDQPELPEGTKCFFTGRPAVNWTLWGRSY